MNKFLGIIATLALCSRLMAGDSSSAYDRIFAAFKPYLSDDDPLSLPLKLRSVSNDPYTHWRGTSPLFYRWAAESCSDWLADHNTYLLCHGDLHLGNMGSYASSDQFGRLSFGLVDFDEACLMPFQIELLQGYISLRLAAQKSGLSLSDQEQAMLSKTLIANYFSAFKDTRNASELLGQEGALQPLFWDARKEYRKVFKQLLTEGRFKTCVLDKDGNIKDLLRPAMNLRSDFAAGIAQAIAGNTRAQKLFRIKTDKECFAAIKDIAQRTRIDSSGSQGLQKYYVLLEKPFVGIDHDIVLYMKREVRCAAEHSAMIGPGRESPGERVSKAADALSNPPLWLNMWCDIGNGEQFRSYWITLREPWSEDLSPSVPSTDNLLDLARIWAIATGCAHRQAHVLKLTDERASPSSQAILTTELMSRGEKYLSQIQRDYAEFIADPRLKSAQEQIEQFLLTLK